MLYDVFYKIKGLSQSSYLCLSSVRFLFRSVSNYRNWDKYCVSIWVVSDVCNVFQSSSRYV